MIVRNAGLSFSLCPSLFLFLARQVEIHTAEMLAGYGYYDRVNRFTRGGEEEEEEEEEEKEERRMTTFY